MPRKTRQLSVWVESDRIAVLEQRKRYQISCRYTDLALERWPMNTPVISCSLPLSDRPADALPFCSGLLPEGAALEAAAQQAKVSVIDVFELLAHFGRDVAGALVICEGEPAERDPLALPYTAAQLAEDVAGLPDRPLGLQDDSELSLPGMQNKLLLVRLLDGGWGRPVHGFPSTHILKADDSRYPGLVDAEAAALQLARTVGLTTITPEIADIGDVHCLIVSRYDRRIDAAGSPVRVHQEDVCQALGFDPTENRGRIKYERYGGPAFAALADLLSAVAGDVPAELDRLVEIMTFTVLIGNADAHGKNLSLLQDPLGTVRLASLYDTVPTALWPQLHKQCAMRINGRDLLDQVTIADIVAEAGRWGHSPRRASAAATQLTERVLSATRSAAVADNVAALVRVRAGRLLGAASRRQGFS